ncbi:ABC transporter permease [Aeromicrobium sp. IC_218]|uniref:FtsX-like permease family protein n=1 Tax=Aeromicrobium sp. IC_218 TaxID=2545468 RepID=UPI00103C15E7|nr:ABC transporter permease [Aeromicrobium sp. IC_218]TCI99403.1 ABC transporter permease [Aeromicrobium sp. IC_218]
MRRRGPGSVTSLVVVALVTAYATVLLTTIVMLGRISRENGFTGDGSREVLAILGTGFLVVAVVVSATVLTNAYAVVTASRARDVALRRLLGSSVAQERRLVVRDGLRTGVLGVAAGLVGGVAINAVIGVTVGGGLRSGVVEPLVVVPCAGVLLTAVLAAWRGSSAVLDVQPAQALGAAAAVETGAPAEPPRWTAVARVLVVLGLLGVGGAAAGGVLAPQAAYLGLLGGPLLAFGVVLSAPALFPRWLNLLGRLWPSTPSGVLAQRRLAHNPERTGRTAAGVVVIVSVVTMFVVASATLDRAVDRMYEGTSGAEGAADTTMVLAGVVSVMVSAAALISAIGLCQTIGLGARMRRRETGLMRVLGQSRADVRAVTIGESARLGLGAVTAGLLLGTFVGWAGAQSLMGSVVREHVVAPVVPWWLLLALAVVTMALAVGAALAPLRDNLRGTPLAALRG